MEIICGVYKITSPSNRVYIGQSNNIHKRRNFYKNNNCKGQILLYSSFNKYGFENHKFEVIEICPESQLNEREIYYIELFQTFNTKHGLNLKGGGKYGTHSNETRRKLSISNTGKNHTEETKRKISVSMIGRETSDETRKKLSVANTGKKASDETRKKLSISHKGNKHTEESKRKISLNNAKTMLGKHQSEELIYKRVQKILKLVLNTQTGIYYIGVREAANSIPMNHRTLTNMLCGQRKNKTSLIYA